MQHPWGCKKNCLFLCLLPFGGHSVSFFAPKRLAGGKYVGQVVSSKKWVDGEQFVNTVGTVAISTVNERVKQKTEQKIIGMYVWYKLFSFLLYNRRICFAPKVIQTLTNRSPKWLPTIVFSVIPLVVNSPPWRGSVKHLKHWCHFTPFSHNVFEFTDWICSITVTIQLRTYLPSCQLKSKLWTNSMQQSPLWVEQVILCI